MVVRWAPSIIQVAAYYANLMLISSFFGLGLGSIVSGRGWRLFRWFPLLLLVFVLFCWASHGLTVPSHEAEFRFYSSAPRLFNYITLIGLFLLNAAVFVPIGERIGSLFRLIPPLRAYGSDLLGSLAGTLVFGLFSFACFSPGLGIGLAIVLYFLQCYLQESIGAGVAVLAAILCAGAIVPLVESDGIWSPYHNILIREESQGFGALPVPPADLKTMKDPPIYDLAINRNFYHRDGTIDLARYSPHYAYRPLIEFLNHERALPFRIALENKRVAVIGSGGGMDVEAALLAGAGHVDAVDIDPKIIELCKTYNASGVCDDPRVSITNDDARAFFQRASPGYDAIVFGFLDSQGLATSMANLRLDGFVYTVESFRSAYSLLKDDGVLSVSFATFRRPWMAAKLVQMLREASGKTPLYYTNDEVQQIVAGDMLSQMIVTKGNHRPPPARFGGFHRSEAARAEVPSATDDWPYLYLQTKTIPQDYLIIIGTLLTISLGALALLNRQAMGGLDLHFLFLGVGFMLLETTCIVESSLYFGGTWLVTLIVVAGVLLMVLFSNLATMALKPAPRLHFALLLGSLGLLYLVPSGVILAFPFAGRLAWAVLVMPLPIFFAGLIFSGGLKHSKNVAASFGANLMGAMIGGFCEYSGMAIGFRNLSMIVLAAYLLSLACLELHPQAAS